jgi:hypothetical protein
VAVLDTHRHHCTYESWIRFILDPFQCPFFFAIFALASASEIELLLPRACCIQF